MLSVYGGDEMLLAGGSYSGYDFDKEPKYLNYFHFGSIWFFDTQQARGDDFTHIVYAVLCQCWRLASHHCRIHSP